MKFVKSLMYGKHIQDSSSREFPPLEGEGGIVKKE